MIDYKPVDLPERTVTVRTKSGTYVYLTQRVEYSSKLKCSRPKRIAIGKLNEKGMLIPNQNYLIFMVSLLNLMFLVKELILYLVVLLSL